MISILFRCFRDLYLCLRVKREEIECREQIARRPEEKGQTRAIRRECIRGLSLHLFHGLARACRHTLCHGRGPRPGERKKGGKKTKKAAKIIIKE